MFFGIEGCIKADAMLTYILKRGLNATVFSVPSIGNWAAPELADFEKRTRLPADNDDRLSLKGIAVIGVIGVTGLEVCLGFLEPPIVGCGCLIASTGANILGVQTSSADASRWRTEARVLVPFVRLSEATKQALEAEGHPPIYVHTPGPFGYIDALETAWNTGRGFLNVEQDKIPPRGALAELWDCPEPWCCCPCRMTTGGYTDFPSLSTVKFSDSMVRLYPDFMAQVRTVSIGDTPAGHYSRLDMAIFTHATLGYNLKPHWHKHLEIQHNHEGEIC